MLMKLASTNFDREFEKLAEDKLKKSVYHIVLSKKHAFTRMSG